MSVGKGSIQRAAKAKEAAEKKEAAAEEAIAKQDKAAEGTPEKKAAPAKKTAKKTQEKKPGPVAAASVIASDDIHEKKFEAVSHIYCELPIYLL